MNMLSIPIFKKVNNTKIYFIIASCIYAAAFFVARNPSTLIQFLIGWAGVLPIGLGLMYYPALFCAWEWFPDRKGLIAGIICSGFGFSAAAFSPISTHFVNPDEADATEIDPKTGLKYFTEDITSNLSYMIDMLLIIYGSFLVVGIILISRPGP